MNKRFPPHGRQLAERLHCNDPPFLVVVTCADECWDQAKRWCRASRDNVALPYVGEFPPQRYRWPVKDCLCLVSHGICQDDDVINDLTTELLKAGASWVIVYDFWVASIRAIYPAQLLIDVAA